MSKRTIVILFFILIAACILRFWQLGKIPISPDWDEVSLGYNAYSIMHTGRDEYGKLMPIILRSFDDYKPALYSYLAMPFIAIFGLEIFAVRLPSAIFGILTVLATFFLVKELFKKDALALLVSFLLAISPWHIQFSRIAFESNVGMALNIFAVLFFIKGLKTHWLLFLSAFIFGLNLHVYQSEKVFVPLIGLILVCIFRRQFFSIKKKFLLISFLIFAIISLPLIYFTLNNKEALARARGVSIFSDAALVQVNSEKLIRDRENKDILGLVLDNRRIEYARNVLSGYLSHFDINWLFVTGDLSRHHAPNMGLMYLWELPFLLIGIYSLSVGRFSQAFGAKEKLLIFLWFLLAPIPASITSGVPHAVRTLNFLPLFQIITAVGVLAAVSMIGNIKYKMANIGIKYLIFSLFFLFFTFNFLYYLNQYFVQQNYFTAYDWQYGYKEIMPTVYRVEGNYKKIVVSNEPPMDQSYMFFLFYLKYPPSSYQSETTNASGGFRENHKFGKFEFRPFNWDNEQKSSGTLYIGRPSDFSYKASFVYTAFYPNGKPAMIVAY